MAQIDSFRHFLINDKIILSSRKSPYSSFLGFTSQLVKLRSSEKTEIFPEKLAKDIGSYGAYEKNWLIEKTEELKQKTHPG